MSKTGDAIVDELRELPENQGRVCGQCFFWRQQTSLVAGVVDNNTGRCCRFPPNIERSTINAFPLVSSGQWCGEWKPVESLATTRLPTGIPE